MKNNNRERFCIVRMSLKLKRLIKYKIEERGSNPTEIARELGFDPSGFRDWLNNPWGKGKASISQFLLMQVADHLGIEVTLDIKLYDKRDKRVPKWKNSKGSHSI